MATIAECQDRLERLGLSKKDVASATGIGYSVLRDYFGGTCKPSPDNLAKIDAYLSGIADGTIPRPATKRRVSASTAADFPAPPHLAEVWSAYLDIRKGKRAANTPSALAYVIKQLEKLAPSDHAKQREIIEQSINRAWVGVFPVATAPAWAQSAATPAAEPEYYKRDYYNGDTGKLIETVYYNAKTHERVENPYLTGARRHSNVCVAP